MTRFWDWYNRHYTLNVTVAASLFALQVVHLAWLTFDPLWLRLFGEPLLELDRLWSWPLVLVDYTEKLLRKGNGADRCCHDTCKHGLRQNNNKDHQQLNESAGET